MKTLSSFVLTLVVAAPVFAQGAATAPQAEETRAYLTATGGLAIFSNVSGFSTAGNQATPDVAIDLGVRFRTHLLVFGEGGWLRNLQRGIQPLLVDTTTTVYANHLIGLTGTGSLAAWYGLGGAGVAGPTWGRWTPYLMGGIGMASLDPSLHFTYNSGTLPGQTTAPSAGTEVTDTLTSAGYLTPPPSSTARMVMVSGGVQLALSPRWIADGQYRYSQIAADSVLASKTIGINAITVGLGVRF
jgi:opacity protein-like surface antigen